MKRIRKRRTGGRMRLRATEVHEDSRTARERTRGDAAREAITRSLNEELDVIDDALSRYA